MNVHTRACIHQSIHNYLLVYIHQKTRIVIGIIGKIARANGPLFETPHLHCVVLRSWRNSIEFNA